MEDNTKQDPTACEEMELCHFFESKILFEVMRSLTDVNIYDLKTATVIAEGIFDHYVNDCVFPEILERKITIMEKHAGQIYNKNAVIALIRVVRQNPKLFN